MLCHLVQTRPVFTNLVTNSSDLATLFQIMYITTNLQSLSLILIMVCEFCLLAKRDNPVDWFNWIESKNSSSGSNISWSIIVTLTGTIVWPAGRVTLNGPES